MFTLEALLETGIHLLRLLIAWGCGFAIGYERKNRSKMAGVRTHAIVACGAALVMIVSRYAFGGSAGDHTRIAANIVTGIGFLGAGMILVNKRTVTGLTTAAGIWTTSAIGMAIGGGLYIVGIVSCGIVLLTQILLHSSYRIFREPQIRELSFYGVADAGFLDEAKRKLKEMDINVTDVAASKENGLISYHMTAEFLSDYNEEQIVSAFECDCSVSAAAE